MGVHTNAVHRHVHLHAHRQTHAVLAHIHNKAGGVEEGGGYCLRGRGLAL